MQQMIYVECNYLSEINALLAKGWKVISVTPVFKCNASGQFSTGTYGAYVVIEEDKG